MIGRNHLRVVSDRYDGTVVDGKASLSTEDAKIIDMLIDYHVSLEHFELASLLSEWKRVSDSKFVDMVMKYTDYDEIEHKQESSNEDGEMEFFPTFIIFDKSMFNVNQISLIKSSYGWSETRLCNVFYIELNSREQHPVKGQVVRLEFKIEEHRDRELDKLKERLISYGIKFI